MNSNDSINNEIDDFINLKEERVPINYLHT